LFGGGKTLLTSSHFGAARCKFVLFVLNGIAQSGKDFRKARALRFGFRAAEGGGLVFGPGAFGALANIVHVATQLL
jgi:hypothetical protein